MRFQKDNTDADYYFEFLQEFKICNLKYTPYLCALILCRI
jgi:hypothetical protein